VKKKRLDFFKPDDKIKLIKKHFDEIFID